MTMEDVALVVFAAWMLGALVMYLIVRSGPKGDE